MTAKFILTLTRLGITTLGGSTRHRAGGGRKTSRTGNPGTGNRRPGMRQRRETR